MKAAICICIMDLLLRCWEERLVVLQCCRGRRILWKGGEGRKRHRGRSEGSSGRCDPQLLHPRVNVIHAIVNTTTTTTTTRLVLLLVVLVRVGRWRR